MKSSIALIALLICGCATQDAHKAYFNAQEKMRMATNVADPKSPTLAKAFDALTAGRAQMLDARYDHALRNFNQSIRLSDQAIEEAAKNLPPPPLATPEIKSPPPEEVVVSNAVEIPVEIAEVEVVADNSVVVDNSIVADNSIVVANVIEIKDEPSPSPEVKAIPVKPAKPKPKKEVAVRPGAILAPSAQSIKKKPGVAAVEKSKEEEMPAVAESVEKKSSPDEKRRRVPGVISFIVNDASLLQESMTSLNQMSKYLLENPSTTLVLEGTYSGDEARNLVDARFDSIKAYLVGKGVPEDQVRLDESKRRGASEFKLFVIEH